MKFLQGLSPVAVVTLSILLVEHVTTVTLTRFTQQRDGVPRLAPTVAVLLTEMLKMVLALVLELNECRGLGSGSSIGAVYDAVVGRPCRPQLLNGSPLFRGRNYVHQVVVVATTSSTTDSTKY